MAFSALIVLALMFCGIALAGVRITPAQGLWLTVALVVGSIPFCAIGLALGFTAGPNSAPGLVNVVHLAGAFTGGLWMPLEILPQTFRTLAPWLPHYHLGQLALSTIGQTPISHPAWNVAMLAAWTIVGTAAAVAAVRRDEGTLYG
jgi:ABC-2 type transport system permease protein